MQNGQKKQEYSSTLVIMVIFILSLFIILPPAFRLLFPADDGDDVEKLSYLITCSKNASTTEGYFAESKIYYMKGKPTKNIIEFYDLRATQKREGDVTEEVGEPELIDKSEQVVGDSTTNVNPTPSIENQNEENINQDPSVTPEGEVVEDILPTDRTIPQEVEFFRVLEAVNFVENGTISSVEINRDSLVTNEGNTHLQNYLLNDMSQHELFYHELGYVCIKEEITSE